MAWRGAWRLSAIMRRSRARHRPARMLASHCSPRRCSLARMQARLPMDAARRGRFCDGCTPGVASSSCRRQSMPHRRAVLAKRDPRRRARRMQDAARGQRRRGERPLEEGPRDGAGTARVREIALHRQPLPRVPSCSRPQATTVPVLGGTTLLHSYAVAHLLLRALLHHTVPIASSQY